MSDIKISKELATKEFANFMDFYGCSDSKENKTHKETLINAIISNKISFVTDDDGDITVVQKTRRDTEIKYGVVTGANKVQMGSDDNNFEAMYSLMGSVSGDGSDAIKSLRAGDLKICESLFVFFAV